jgi:hypothetical protein
MNELMDRTRERLTHWATWRPMLERWDYLQTMSGQTLEARLMELGDGVLVKGSGKSDGGALMLYESQRWAAGHVARAREVAKIVARLHEANRQVLEAFYRHGETHASGAKAAASVLTQRWNKPVSEREADRQRVHVETRVMERLYPMQDAA